MQKTLMILAIAFGVAGCGQLVPESFISSGAADGQTRPQARPPELAGGAPVPSPTARTVEEFDTASQEAREEAASTEGGPGELIGVTVVSLGDPARPGFWIETPLVTKVASGRVVNPDNGQAVQVDLLPIDGPDTAGSRMSLAAMRLVGLPLAGLTEVEVYSGG